MASGRGTTYDSLVLQHILGAAAFTAPGGVWIGLLSATPATDNGTFTELTSGNSPGYVRATIDSSNTAASWSATTTDTTGVWKTNASSITYPTATAGWTAATGFAIYDAATVGNVVYWGSFGSSSTVGSGATASFASGAIKITEA